MWIKEHLIAAGLDEKVIRTLDRGSNERLWIDETTGMSSRNCRSDIIISEEVIDVKEATEILEDEAIK